MLQGMDRGIVMLPPIENDFIDFALVTLCPRPTVDEEARQCNARATVSTISFIPAARLRRKQEDQRSHGKGDQVTGPTPRKNRRWCSSAARATIEGLVFIASVISRYRSDDTLVDLQRHRDQADHAANALEGSGEA
jgi:hypothetical protein